MFEHIKRKIGTFALGRIHFYFKVRIFCSGFKVFIKLTFICSKNPRLSHSFIYFATCLICALERTIPPLRGLSPRGCKFVSVMSDHWSLIVWTCDKMAGRIITRCVSRALVEFGSGANCVKSRGTNRNYWTALRRTSTALTVNNDASFSSKITLLHSLSHCFLYLYASSVICAQEGQWCHFLRASYLIYRWRGNGFVNAVRAAYPCRKRTTSTV